MKDKDLKKTVDRVIAQLTEIRKAEGLSHEKVAQKAGLNRSTISLIESRKTEPTFLTVLKISKALNIDIKELL
jgi:transcriptional regulator with XRE-family HTH domain